MSKNRKLSKKERSNALRLAALQERKHSQGPSLKIPETPGLRPSNHTLFTDDRPEKLTLFESNDIDSDDEVVFGERFQGTGGEKLLQLQRSIGLDQRFRLDDKFMDDPTSDDPAIDEEAMKSTDNERSRSLAVLDSLLGPSVVSRVTKPDVVIPPRYDPLSTTHTLHEQSRAAITDKEESSEGESDGEQSNTRPTVSGDTFYSINTDLHGLFAAEDQGFNFLGPESESEHESVEEEIVEEVQRPIKVECDDMEVRKDERMFFHHSGEVPSHTFYRLESLRCLEEGWPERRAAFKQAFRKRHRDASKTVSKFRKHL